jgi:hypothetical protein
MQTNNGITISVIHAATPMRLPVSVLLDGGITLVRIPHGPFKLRIFTPHPTDVSVTLDDRKLATKSKIPAGMSELVSGDGGLFVFSPDSKSTPAPLVAVDRCDPDDKFIADIPKEVLAEVAVKGVDDVDEILARTADATTAETDATEDGAVEEAPTQPAHAFGFLVVGVSFTEQPIVPGVLPLPSNVEEVAFQMNQPGDHERAVAANVHNIVPPEKIEPRWCSHCKRLER